MQEEFGVRGSNSCQTVPNIISRHVWLLGNTLATVVFSLNYTFLSQYVANVLCSHHFIELLPYISRIFRMFCGPLHMSMQTIFLIMEENEPSPYWIFK